MLELAVASPTLGSLAGEGTGDLPTDPGLEGSHLRPDQRIDSFDLADAAQHVPAVDSVVGTGGDRERRLKLDAFLGTERGRGLPEPVEVEVVDPDDRRRSSADVDSIDPAFVPIEPGVPELDRDLRRLVHPVAASVAKPGIAEASCLASSKPSAHIEVGFVVFGAGVQLLGGSADDDGLDLEEIAKSGRDEQMPSEPPSLRCGAR